MKHKRFFLIAFSCIFSISCKKNNIVNDEIVSPKNVIKTYVLKETYTGKKLRDTELNFSYDSKGKLESIARTLTYYDLSTENPTSKNQNLISLTYNAEGLLSETKTISKIDNNNESIGIERYVYDSDKVAEIRAFLIKNGSEVSFPLGNLNFGYDSKGQLISYSYGGENRNKYNYVNNIHSTTSLLLQSSDAVFIYHSILSPVKDYTNAQKIIISQIIEDASTIGFGLISNYTPKSIDSKNFNWTYEVNANDKNFPSKIIKKNKTNTIEQVMTFEYQSL